MNILVVCEKIHRQQIIFFFRFLVNVPGTSGLRAWPLADQLVTPLVSDESHQTLSQQDGVGSLTVMSGPSHCVLESKGK